MKADELKRQVFHKFKELESKIEFHKINQDSHLFNFFRRFLFVLALATCVEMVFLCYYLRPLSWDGSRYAFFLIHYGKPFYDAETYRLITVIFQIPTIIIEYFFTSASPLLLVRIYFFTLVMPIYSYLTYRIFRAKSMSDLFILSSLMFIILLPAMSFTINAMFETVFFYFLAFEAFLNKKFKTFIALTFICSVGHPSIILGFLLFILIHIYFYYQEKTKAILFCLISTIVFSAIVIARTLNAIKHDPKSKYFFTDVLKDVVISYSHPRVFTIYAGIIFALLIFTLLVFEKFKYKNMFFLAGSSIIAFYIFNSMDPGLLLAPSHAYRVFSLILTLCVILFMLYRYFKRSVNPEIMLQALILISIMGIWHLSRDVYINIAQKKLNSLLSESQITETNCVIHPEIPLEYFSTGSIPVLKLFLDNNRTIQTVHYVPDFAESTEKETVLCGHVSSSFIPLDYFLLDHGVPDLNSFYGLEIKHSGFFTFKL